MASSRNEVFEQMLRDDPANAMVMFGLAKEYEKARRYAEVVTTLTSYLKVHDDEGNAYGMLAQAYEKTGDRAAARAAYERGIGVAESHRHPSMAEDYRMTLESEYED